jgi:hypothetical protein
MLSDVCGSVCALRGPILDNMGIPGRLATPTILSLVLALGGCMQDCRILQPSATLTEVNCMCLSPSREAWLNAGPKGSIDGGSV